ncbi:hypothetical protein Dimus_022709 [Dionaea muscipula]
MGVTLREKVSVHSTKRLFGKQEEYGTKRKLSVSPKKVKKSKKAKTMKTPLRDSETVASIISPPHAESQGEVEQHHELEIREQVHVDEQVADRVTQNHPHGTQEPAIPTLVLDAEIAAAAAKLSVSPKKVKKS